MTRDIMNEALGSQAAGIRLRTRKTKGVRSSARLSLSTATRAQAEQRARQWRLDGQAALENNNQAWAKECFAKALDWQTKVNEWDAEPVTDMARSRPSLKVGFPDVANGA